MSRFRRLTLISPTETAVSPLTLVADSLASPPPADHADPSVLELPPGVVLWLLGGIYAAAHAAYQGALSAGHDRVNDARRQAAGTAKAAQEANVELRRLRYERKAARRRRVTAETLLAGRLRRSRLTRRQAIALVCAIALGEVALNASAAIGQGDVVWLSVLAFVGVGAATIGIGMGAALIREAVDQAGYHTTTVPPEATAAHLEHFFVPARRLRAKWAVSAGAISISIIALAVAVGALRAEGGFSPLFGVFTAVTVIGAAVIAYSTADPVADLFENLDTRIAHLDTRIQTAAAIVGRHHAARVNAATITKAAHHDARAQWDLVLAQGLLNLPPHLAGHAGTAALIALSPHDYHHNTWRNTTTTHTNNHPTTTPNGLAGTTTARNSMAAAIADQNGNHADPS